MQEATNCLNCGAIATNHFCSMCGEETHPHVPSALEFIHEFIGHYVALEGKLWSTIRLLLFKPGMLTLEYIRGRRVRYVAPLRLFLTFSILFFAVLKFSGTGFNQHDKEPASARPAASAAAQQGRDNEGDAGETGFRVTSLSPALQARLERFNALPTEQKLRVAADGFFSYTPYAMFLLMPLFALYLTALYVGSGRRYGEHLLFALHANAFAYLQLALMIVAPWSWLKTALFGWLLLYLPTAMRRVYGGSRFKTFLRWLVLMFLHVLSLGLAIAGALALAVLH